MIIRDAFEAVARRARRPAILGLMAAFYALNLGGVFLAILVQRHMPTPVHAPAPFMGRTALIELWATLFLFLLSPLAWQWTRDARLMARPLRGLLQSLALNAVNITLCALPQRMEIKRQFGSAAQQAPIGGRGLVAAIALGFAMSLAFETLLAFALAFWETKRAEKALAQRQTEEARWALLKAQMSPHVLLNSLGGLAELVLDDPAAAAQGMRDLAEIYGQLLALGQAPLVPLGEERRLLTRYLGVEKLRLGQALDVAWEWDPALDTVLAMPLLLQPLVENAIKHGVAADPEGGRILITARRDPGSLFLAVANTGQAPQGRERKGTGVGLRNLKSRLDLAYGGRASFGLVRESSWMRAEMKLPLEETP
jgi:signal transduction histidine kinase